MSRTRADVEALIRRAITGEDAPSAAPTPPPTRYPLAVDCGDAWQALAPASRRSYLALRAHEAHGRRMSGELGEGWPVLEDEEPADRAERLALMYRERPRPSVTPEWRAEMRAMLARRAAAGLP